MCLISFKKIILSVIILQISILFADNRHTILDIKKQEYLACNGAGNEQCGQNIWAWFENNLHEANASEIHNIITSWSTTGDDIPYCWRWRKGSDITAVMLLRVLFQYGNKISNSDSIMLEELFDSSIRSKYFFHNGTLNNRLLDFTSRYLYSQKKKWISVEYGGNETFVWDGVRYVPGNIYNSYELARDWLYWTFKRLVLYGDDELDSHYTPSLAFCLYALYDFTEDMEMKKRSKMVMDLILIDSILDESARLHGGWLGRTYGYNIIAGQPHIYSWLYWDQGPYHNGSNLQGFFDAFVSTYRIPALIEDIGVLADETDDYWHINYENNRAGFLPTTSGKWTYVTKYYNLGGSPKGWMLNVHSDKDPKYYQHLATPAVGIRMWIDDQPTLPDPEPWVDLIDIGKGDLIQFRNAMYLDLDNPYLHFMSLGNVFDIDETITDWRFLKEGKVSVAVRLDSNFSALEVALIGSDYPSYDDFKQSILNNARLYTTGLGSYKTSKGDSLWRKYDQQSGSNIAYVNQEELKRLPFPRNETIDNQGNKLVSWNSSQLTLDKNGIQIIYDFYDWTYIDYGSTIPPDPPLLLEVEKNASQQLAISFLPVPGVQLYHVYRDTTSLFTPDIVNGVNRIPPTITRLEMNMDTLFWNETQSIYNPPYNNYYYALTSVGGIESDPAKRFGIHNFHLITTPKTDFNSISIPVQMEGISDAEDLLQSIQGSNSVAVWNPVSQGYDQYIPSIPATNFPVEHGYPYLVNVTSDAVFTLYGKYANPHFSLITTQTTDFNEIILPLGKGDITTASELLANIATCNAVAWWNTEIQGYIQYIPVLDFTDFELHPGNPYMVNVTSDVIWPTGSYPKKTFPVKFENRKGEKCQAPHIVWGRVPNKFSNNRKLDLSFTAYRKTNPNEKLTEMSPGSKINNNIWLLQCQAFTAGWKAGDTLIVNLFNKKDEFLTYTAVLTYNSADSCFPDNYTINPTNQLPASYELHQNYPNPFNGKTVIPYDLPEDKKVTIEIYNTLGQKVKTLIDNKQEAGFHSISWNGTDYYNKKLSSGIYIILLKSGSFSQTKKILLIQ
jgi:hypothetical protein